ncbi:hypothetical protein [Ochrobactrum soli]|uniref:hypothetical protein n=1 Tax=Ochrobactrum soli TaxID=2448455 RepID=UPI001F23408B|nr:hypothetical protein [[Ochrobactrum] soli]
MAKTPKQKPVPAPPERVGKLPCNEARGEVRLFVDDVELVIAAELARLSAISSRLQCKSLNDLFLRLSATEIEATIAGIEFLTVRGDAAKALSKLKLKHFGGCSIAFLAALNHHFEGEQGNAGAAGEAA